MRPRSCFYLSLLCTMSVIVLVLSLGCVTSPTTGKTTFDTAAIQSATTNPVVIGAVGSLPFPWGEVGVGILVAANAALTYAAKRRSDANHATTQQLIVAEGAASTDAIPPITTAVVSAAGSNRGVVTVMK